MQAKNAVGFNTPGAASSAADFGRVLAGFWEVKMVPKSRFLVFFWNMLAETLFLVEFCWIFYKIDSQKHTDFRWIFSASFHQLLLQSGDLLNARNLENSDFPQGKCIFL
jgi:hypothetical protein